MWSTADTKAFEFGGSKSVCVCVMQLLPLVLRVDLPRYHIDLAQKLLFLIFPWRRTFPLRYDSSELRTKWWLRRTEAPVSRLKPNKTTDDNLYNKTSTATNLVSQPSHALSQRSICAARLPHAAFVAANDDEKIETILIKKRRFVFLKRPPKCCFPPFASHSLTTTLSQFTRRKYNGRIYGRNVLLYRNSLS